MSARVIQEGFKTVGIDAKGNLGEVDVAIVIGEVPGEYGEWCYVVIEQSFCWVKGMEEGFRLYKYPLNGPQNTWQPQIEIYLAKGPIEEDQFTEVIEGAKLALAQENFFIVAN